MKMPDELRQQVAGILVELDGLQDKLGSREIDFEECFQRGDVLLHKLEDIDAGLEGFVPGRLVKISEADSYAAYVVGDIGPQTTEMLHVPYGDCWHSNVVHRGKALTGTIREMVGWDDLIRSSLDPPTI